MDGTKHITDDQTALEDMPETGGDVRANEEPKHEESGEKGGQALQEQQEVESYQEFEVKGSEDKSNESSESDDLWGEE